MSLGFDALSQDPVSGLPSSGSANYTLSGAAGSYVYTGQASTLTVKRVLNGASGSYASNGQIATVAFGRKLAGTNGVYSYSGQAATLVDVHHYAMAGATGNYGIIGIGAALTYTPTLPIITVSPFGGLSKKKHKKKEVEEEIEEVLEIEPVKVKALTEPYDIEHTRRLLETYHKNLNEDDEEAILLLL